MEPNESSPRGIWLSFDIISEISRSFDYFRDTTNYENISAIVLCGGGALTADFVSLLSDRSLNNRGKPTSPQGVVNWYSNDSAAVFGNVTRRVTDSSSALPLATP